MATIAKQIPLSASRSAWQAASAQRGPRAISQPRSMRKFAARCTTSAVLGGSKPIYEASITQQCNTPGIAPRDEGLHILYACNGVWLGRTLCACESILCFFSPPPLGAPDRQDPAIPRPQDGDEGGVCRWGGGGEEKEAVCACTAPSWQLAAALGETDKPPMAADPQHSDDAHDRSRRRCARTLCTYAERTLLCQLWGNCHCHRHLLAWLTDGWAQLCPQCSMPLFRGRPLRVRVFSWQLPSQTSWTGTWPAR